MSRPHIEAIHYTDIEPGLADSGVFPGVRQRVLSRDDGDGSYSAVIYLKRGDLVRPQAPRGYEIFILAGQLHVSGKLMSGGHYVSIPSGHSPDGISAVSDSVLFFALSNSGADDGNLMLVDPATMPWDTKVYENVPEATGGKTVINCKILRSDRVSHVTTFLAAMTPEANQDCAESHAPIDEGLVLRGDMLVLGPNREPVVMRPGSYYWRPPHVRHLPKYSFGGNLRLVRTIGEEGLDCKCTHMIEAQWPEAVAAYKRDRVFFEAT